MSRETVPRRGPIVKCLGFNHDAKLKKGMGEIKVGDVKEFRLTVNKITGYEKLGPGSAHSGRVADRYSRLRVDRSTEPKLNHLKP